jgi:hypothetical protein
MSKSIPDYFSVQINKSNEDKYRTIIEKISENSSLYQKLFVAYISLGYMISMLNYMTASFVFMNPIF